jgi:hypothetical protein
MLSRVRQATGIIEAIVDTDERFGARTRICDGSFHIVSSAGHSRSSWCQHHARRPIAEREKKTPPTSAKGTTASKGDGSSTSAKDATASKGDGTSTSAKDTTASKGDGTSTLPFTTEVSLRCPAAFVPKKLRRVQGLRSPQGVRCLFKGEAFVSEASDLIGVDSPLLKWDPEYLERHLPKDMEWSVYNRGTRKIVMGHTSRYMNWADLAKLDASGLDTTAGEKRFTPVRRVDMTFASFMAATSSFERALRKSQAKGEAAATDPPYLGAELLLRPSMEDEDGIAHVGSTIRRDLVRGMLENPALRELITTDRLPRLNQLHMFVGSARTLYHCHYDIQPNLHVQLVGRKRFILFPPEEYERLHPFPVHHDYDRRAQIDLDAPDDSLFPGCTSARGVVVELEPNDVLYIPPCWWHHVQTLTTPCVSMACNFFPHVKGEARPECVDSAGHKLPVDRRHFGLGERAVELMAIRWLEEFLGRMLAPITSGAAGLSIGEERASKDGSSWGGPEKERAVAQWMVAMGGAAASRLLARGRREEARGVPPLMSPPTDLPEMQHKGKVAFNELDTFLRIRLALELGDPKAPPHSEFMRVADLVDAFIVKAVRHRGFDRKR